MRRFSLAALMVVVLICGLAVAALKHASDGWAASLLGVTLLLLGTSIAGAIYRREARRAFWLGFALFGWGYLVLSLGPWFREFVSPVLPTSLILEYVHAKANQTPPIRKEAEVITRLDVSGTQTNATQLALRQLGDNNLRDYDNALLAPSNERQFGLVGHCLFTLLIALMGGGIFRWFQRTNETA